MLSCSSDVFCPFHSSLLSLCHSLVQFELALAAVVLHCCACLWPRLFTHLCGSAVVSRSISGRRRCTWSCSSSSSPGSRSVARCPESGRVESCLPRHAALPCLALPCLVLPRPLPRPSLSALAAASYSVGLIVCSCARCRVCCCAAPSSTLAAPAVPVRLSFCSLLLLEPCVLDS